MASIVKELDKVTGATTRSHNIADAVSKLKRGAFIVNLTMTDYGAEDYTITADKSFSEVEAAIENGMLVHARGNWGGICYSLSEYNLTDSGSKYITFSALSPQSTYCDFSQYTMTEDGSIRDLYYRLKFAE